MKRKQVDRDVIEEALKEFTENFSVSTKGPLSVVLVLTRSAQAMTPPFEAGNFLTHHGGQVAGLGRSAVQAILRDYGIDKILAEEGGRTSRGSIRRMQEYIKLLNKLAAEGILDLKKIEQWWIKKIQEHFASQPLKLKEDRSKSLSQLISDLMNLAYKRQQTQKGTMVAGAVMQHIVGAKLEIAIPAQDIVHKGFSVADKPTADAGDFVLGDCAIHVTTAPTEGLIRKCQANLDKGLRPIIITSEAGLGGAKALARSLDLEDRIDVFEISQFIALNIYEWASFHESSRPFKIGELIDEYNKIIEIAETDHSLKIELG